MTITVEGVSLDGTYRQLEGLLRNAHLARTPPPMTCLVAQCVLLAPTTLLLQQGPARTASVWHVLRADIVVPVPQPARCVQWGSIFLALEAVSA